MRRIQIGIALCCCLFATTRVAKGQQSKAGLWELTTVMTFQQSPFPSGSPGAAAASRPMVRQICVSQAQIEKYGPLLPLTGGGCHMDKPVKRTQSMSADMVCTGQINGTGTIETTFAAESAQGNAHFAGAIQQGSQTIPIEWTAKVNAVFKSKDCGDLKAAPMPEPSK